MSALLVVEDDETIGRAMQTSLRAHGYEVSLAPTGRAALAEAGQRVFDLVLLDLGLPDVDGVTVCGRLRSMLPAAVVVILTARDAEMDVVIGLDAGADDYLTKPIRLGELHARIRAHLRRSETVVEDAAASTIVLGDLVIDTRSRRVVISGRELSLRAKEYELLVRLAAEPGAAVSRETLMADVWDAHWFGSTKTLDVHVAALRRRMADGGAAAAGAALPTVSTLRGHGYRLDPPG